MGGDDGLLFTQEELWGGGGGDGTAEGLGKSKMGGEEER